MPYPGLAERLRSLDIDVALLPVNGRDPERLARGIPGNFTAREAAELCLRAHIPQLVVHHIGMFAFNTADPAAVTLELRSYEPALAGLLPEPGAYEVRTNEETP